MTIDLTGTRPFPEGGLEAGRQSAGARRRRSDGLRGAALIDALLEPWAKFATPDDVVYDSDLSFDQKRLVLRAWARSLLEEARSGRGSPELHQAVADALALFEPEAAEKYDRLFDSLEPTGERPRPN